MATNNKDFPFLNMLAVLLWARGVDNPLLIPATAVDSFPSEELTVVVEERPDGIELRLESNEGGE